MKTPEGTSGENNPEKQKFVNGPMTAETYAQLVRDFNAIQKPSTTKDPYSDYRRNKQTTEILQGTGLVGVLAVNAEKFNAQDERGLDAANNEVSVESARVDRELQAQALSGIILPEGTFSRKSQDSLDEKTESSLRNAVNSTEGVNKGTNPYLLDGRQASNEVKAASSDVEAKNTEVKKLTSEQENLLAKAKAAMLKPGFLQDALDKIAIQKAQQEGLLTDEPVAVPQVESNSIEFTVDDKKYDVVKTQSAAERNNQTPSQPTAPEVVPAAAQEAPAEVAATPVETQPDQVPKVEASAAENKAPTPEELEAAKRLEEFKRIAAEYTKDDDILRPAVISWNENLKAAEGRVENIKANLEAKKNESKGLLEKMGVGVVKGLDYYRSRKPRTKILLGVALAGASVATGGALSVVTIGLSAGSYGRGFYEKILKAEQDKGNEVNKKWLIARSALYGVVFAVGTSMIFSQVADHMHDSGVMDSVGEKVSSIKDGLKSLFGMAPPASVVAPDGLLHDLPASTVLHGAPTSTEFGPPVWVGEPVVTQPDGLLHDVPTTEYGPPVWTDQAAAIPDAPVPDVAPPDTVAVTEPILSSETSFAQPEPLTPLAEGPVAIEPVTVAGPDTVTQLSPEMYVTPEIPAVMTPINVNDVYTMQPGDSMSSILQRVLATIPESQTMSVEDKAALVTKLTKEWLTPVGSLSSPNWALKEMMTGLPGTQVHHLDHVRDAFNLLLERANPIKN